MDEQGKVNAIVNIGQMKVVEKAYDDVLSKPSQKVGDALSTVLDLGNTVLWPVKWLNERTRIFFENNLKRYQEKLEATPAEKICSVPSEISVPILERLTYVSNKELSEAFTNLLGSASNIDTAADSHPGFITILDRLSADECKILTYLSETLTSRFFPKVICKIITPHKGGGWYLKDFTRLQKNIDLTFKQNIDLYLNNIESLGIIEQYKDEVADFDEQYAELEKFALVLYEKAIQPITEKHEIEFSREAFRISKFGLLFLSACIGKSKHDLK